MAIGFNFLGRHSHFDNGGHQRQEEVQTFLIFGLSGNSAECGGTTHALLGEGRWQPCITHSPFFGSGTKEQENQP